MPGRVGRLPIRDALAACRWLIHREIAVNNARGIRHSGLATRIDSNGPTLAWLS